MNTHLNPIRFPVSVRIIFIVVCLFLSSLKAADGEQPCSRVVTYRVEIDPLTTGTDLHIFMSFEGDSDGVTRIKLPSCRFGTPRIWDSACDVRALGAEIHRIDGKPAARNLIHEPDATVVLMYTMSRKSSDDEGIAYRPSVDDQHFHYFDSQWRARLPERENELSIDFSFDQVPEGWTVFSNLGHGPGPYHVESRGDELSGFIAGGEYHSAQFRVNETDIGVYAHHVFKDPDGLVSAVRSIITRQGEIFGEFGSEFYVVSVTPRESIRAGTAIDHAFVCLTDRDTDAVSLDVLLAHEVFHNWMPGTATLVPSESGSGLDEFRFDWFIEGFTEYIARRVLLDGGRIDFDAFVELFNRDLREQARNSARRASLEVVREAIENGVYSSAHERTSYFRGPIIALNWETRLQRLGEHNVLDVVRAFLDSASSSGGALSEDEFFELIEGFGLDPRDDYIHHIVYGNAPELDADVFGPDYSVERIEVTVVDAGFDILASRRQGHLTGVALDGPAYRAGLRDGMGLVSVREPRSVKTPVQVTVRDRGAEKTFEYSPAQQGVETYRFVRAL